MEEQNLNLKRRLTSRKFLGSATLFVAVTILLVLGYVDGGQWIQMSTITLSVYTGSNVLEKAVQNYLE